ncbi:uncharacterized protein A4U43_C01F29760 [Asparagus officinalis]|uniref:Agenet domain-containing protein n=1 Tax=Asparagus officinalis TaxID=4686 RepID=A0A5P1FTE6_ASPOF|nr:uncharacterized protein A4U43_C01F29760 [Asparagus officinalis]
MIRPRPPSANLATDFELHQCVEVFYNGVWWKGVVTKVPGRDGDLLYSVYFSASREEFQFKASEIWRQIKWAKGEYINVEYGDQTYTNELEIKASRLEEENNITFCAATRTKASTAKIKLSFFLKIACILKFVDLHGDWSVFL